MKIRKGDRVRVITGKDKGKEGTVETAMPREGKIIVVIGEDGGIGYSFNGGRNFTSRPLALPARAQAVTFPDAQHGYLVGQHAMVYRYRIVPIDYTRQGMIAAMAP